jgi:hypothetical protein
MKKIIIISIIIAIILGALGYWYWQSNPYSKEVLKVEILGPAEAKAGQEIEYTVKYKNNGDVRLEQPLLIFELPEYSLTDGPKRIEMNSEELGDIYPGEEKTFKFKTRLLGKEGETRTAKVQVRYQPKNLQATYQSDSSLTTVISSVPLTFEFDLSSKVEAEREFKFALIYSSSIDYTLTNLGVRIEYPNGFEFLSSSPSSLDKTEWDISVLNRAEGGKIEIIGKLRGELKEQKIFKAVIGLWQDEEFIPLKEIIKGVEISKPQLSVLQQINGQTNYIASPGETLHYEIIFRNISKDPFQDLFLIADLDGTGFDFSTIKSQLGGFKQGDDSIMWDYRSVPSLKFLDQGKEGKVEFWIDLKDTWESEDRNTVLKNTISVAQMQEEFQTKVNSKLEISQKIDSGSQSGEEIIYTVTWQAKNYLNDVRNVKTTAILPSNVRFIGNVSPSSESSKFAFDSGSREIIWMIGDMDGGVGVSGAGPTISFQVALSSGSNILGEAIIVGEDQWTEVFINSTAPSLNK